MSILGTCNGNGSIAGTSEPLPAQQFIDVAYGKDSAQRMDVYLPAGRTSAATKSLILIHGGGWNSGNKSEFNAYIDSFKKRMPDYALFNLNYRLVNGSNLFPAQEEDIKMAMNFINAQAGTYAINASKLVLLGASAGGHLALLQGYKYAAPKVAAIVDFFGPADLVTMYEHPWHPLVPYALQSITGTTPAQNPDLYRQSSPVQFVTAASAPTLIFHGSADAVVDVSQSKLLKKTLDAKGVSNELIIYPGLRHGWHGASLSRSFDAMEIFLKKYVP